jgi:hypothetical protein
VLAGSGVAVFVAAAVGASVGAAVGASLGAAVGVLVGGAVGGVSVCVGSGVLVADFVLAGKGVSVGRGMLVADLSALSTTVSAPDGAQDANTKATTKPPCRNNNVLIERHNPPIRFPPIYTRFRRVSKHCVMADQKERLASHGSGSSVTESGRSHRGAG